MPQLLVDKYLDGEINTGDAMRQDALHRDKYDAVDVIVEQWQRERPDLDASAKGVTGRIIRLADLFQRAYGSAFEPLGLNESDYGILAPLRRAGAPYELTPTQLARSRMLSSGGTTAAIDRLERKGFVVRTPNPSDRRGSLVRLTEEGLRVIDEAMARHVEVERRLVAGLGAKEREGLASHLRTLLLGLETS
jgi:DNA-binding MarR family transcriptional regulator